MKKHQYFFIKRITVILLCTVFLFSTIFMSYTNTLTVNASSVSDKLDAEYEDILRTALITAASSLGIFLTGGTATAIMPVVLSGALAETDNLKDYVDTYLYDNGDGTTTISEDFVQLTLQAYNQYKEENAEKFDGTMSPGADGYYYFPEVAFTMFYEPGSFYNKTEIFRDIYTRYPCAVLLRSNFQYNSNTSVIDAYIIFYNPESDEFFSMSEIYDTGYVRDYDIVCPANDSFLCVKMSHHTIVDVIIDEAYFTRSNIGLRIGGYIPGASFSVNSSSIPVYNDLTALKQGLRSEDFSAAYNYGKVSGLESSKYTGSYSGGDIIVANEKLEGISDKLTEIDNTGKDIDDKLKDLLDWLGIGDGNDDIIGGSGSWYDKILLYLDKILKQLKSIKRWTIVDTVIDGVDAIADWLDLIHDILSDVDDGMESAVSTLSSTLDDATGLLKSKFPFSIPWDIFFFVTLLAAEPETPYFEIPIDFDVSALDMHIHYDFVVDFSPYQYLSDISRVLLSMTYAVGLLKMTAGIVSTKKEE